MTTLLIQDSLTYRALKAIDAWYRESGTARVVRRLERLAVEVVSGSVFGRLASGEWPGRGIWEGSRVARTAGGLFERLVVRWGSLDAVASAQRTLALAIDHSFLKGILTSPFLKHSLFYRAAAWLLTEPGKED